MEDDEGASTAVPRDSSTTDGLGNNHSADCGNCNMSVVVRPDAWGVARRWKMIFPGNVGDDHDMTTTTA